MFTNVYDDWKRLLDEHIFTVQSRRNRVYGRMLKINGFEMNDPIEIIYLHYVIIYLLCTTSLSDQLESVQL